MRRSNTNSYDDPEQHHSDSLLLPNSPLATATNKKKRRDVSLNYAQRVPGRLLKHSKHKKSTKSNSVKDSKKWDVSTQMLIVIWYILGVVSISTSKMLLSEFISPLLLSVQQFGKLPFTLHYYSVMKVDTYSFGRLSFSSRSSFFTSAY